MPRRFIPARFMLQILIPAAAIPILAQQAKAPIAAKPDANAGAAGASEAAEILAFEARMEAATVRGDVPYVDKVTAPDFSFTHGDAWTAGAKPLGVDNKAAYLKRVENKQYLTRDLDSVNIELHGNVAITYGRYLAQNRAGDPNNSWFSVWFERVYEKRNGQWLYVSHRTVHGPTRGPTRESVSGK